MASDVPIRIHRGANDPAVIWEFLSADGTPAPLAGHFVLVVEWLAVPARPGQVAVAAGRIARGSDPAEGGGLVVDAAAGSVTWPLTIAESLMVPRGSGARYELFCDTEYGRRPWAGGSVVVEGFLP